MLETIGHRCSTLQVVEFVYLFKGNDLGKFTIYFREFVRNMDLRVQVHPGELWISKQRVHIVLQASKSAGAKGDVPKICGFLHLLHPC